MLSERFFNDGKSVLPLNNMQLEAKKQLENKINNKKYVFEKISCLVCGSNSFEQLSEKDRYGLYMSVVICKKCGLVQTNPRMNLESYTEFYDVEYTKLYNYTIDATKEFQDQYKKGELIYEYIEQVTGQPIKNKFIVEIGTGAGGILKYFQDHGNEVFGIDLGHEFIEYGKKKGLNLEVGTVKKLSSLKHRPDIIIYSQVIEHLLNPIGELLELQKFLSPDSVVYVEVPGIKHLTISYYRDFLKFLQNAHVYHFTLNSLCNCFKKAGFELISGNELITSLFRLGKIDDIYKSDYDSTVNFLKKLEKTRSYLNLFTIKLKIFALIIFILEKTRTVRFAKKIYYKSKI
ncbi:MAG: class I SAM-dependent methyltransferase [Nitrosotalea sp.]